MKQFNVGRYVYVKMYYKKNLTFYTVNKYKVVGMGLNTQPSALPLRYYTLYNNINI